MFEVYLCIPSYPSFNILCCKFSCIKLTKCDNICFICIPLGIGQGRRTSTLDWVTYDILTLCLVNYSPEICKFSAIPTKICCL